MLNSFGRMLIPEIAERKTRRSNLSTRAVKLLNSSAESSIEFSPEKDFQTFLYFERRRSTRSKRCFALLLLEVSPSLQKSEIESLVRALRNSTRETDIVGWYKTGAVIGVVFTEVDPASSAIVSEVLLNKTIGALSLRFSQEIMSSIRATVTAFPEKVHDERPAELTRAAAG